VRRASALKVLGVAATLVALAGGCASTQEAGCADAAGTSGESICVDSLTVRGSTWTSWPLASRLDRDLVGPPLTGSQQGCQDPVGVCADRSGPERATLRRIDGIPGSQALARVGYPRDVIYVPGDVELTFEELPESVQRLVRHTR